MIARLKGKIVEKESRSLIVDVQGVGYRVFVLGATLGKIRVDDALILLIYHHVNEGAETLYGFTQTEDLRYFELLLTVPSVGPRTAMNILDIAPPHLLEQAVINNDVKLLTRVSGVGRKTAERILVELREKIKGKRSDQRLGDLHDEALAALTSIGFTSTQARQALQGLPVTIKTVEEAVRIVLQSRGRKK